MSMQDFDTAMMRAAGRPRFLAGSNTADPPPERLAANFAVVEAEIDAPDPIVVGPTTVTPSSIIAPDPTITGPTIRAVGRIFAVSCIRVSDSRV